MTPTCQYIFPDNHRCGSPALRSEPFCFYHHPSRKPAATRRIRRGFHIAAPTDPRSLQNALSEIIVRLAANKLDVHRAGLLIYSLQIAGQTLSAG